MMRRHYSSTYPSYTNSMYAHLAFLRTGGSNTYSIAHIACTNGRENWQAWREQNKTGRQALRYRGTLRGIHASAAGVAGMGRHARCACCAASQFALGLSSAGDIMNSKNKAARTSCTPFLLLGGRHGAEPLVPARSTLPRIPFTATTHTTSSCHH